MKIYYRILSVYENEGNIVIRYFTDFLTEEELAISKDIDDQIIYDANGYPQSCRTDYNITLYENLNPTEEDIKKIARVNVPIGWFRVQENIKSNSNYSVQNIIPLIGEKNEFDSNEVINFDRIVNLADDVFITGNLTVTGTVTGTIIPNTP